MTLFSGCKRDLILIAILLLIPVVALANDARLSEITATNNRDDLLVYMNVEGAFREKIEKAVLSGVPTSFSFVTSLYETRSLWLDRKVTEIRSIHTIKYNNLKKEFTVKRSWESGEPRVTRSFEEARKLMTEIDSLKIISLAKLEKSVHYQIRAKAELSKFTLPFYLHHVLFFVSLWDFETDWYIIDFVY
jgi:hypothetical protein